MCKYILRTLVYNHHKHMYHYFTITLLTVESNLTSYVSLSLFAAVSQKHDSFISSENNKNLIKGMNCHISHEASHFQSFHLCNKDRIFFIALRSWDFFIDPAETRQTKSLFQPLLRFLFFFLLLSDSVALLLCLLCIIQEGGLEKDFLFAR